MRGTSPGEGGDPVNVEGVTVATVGLFGVGAAAIGGRAPLSRRLVQRNPYMVNTSAFSMALLSIGVLSVVSGLYFLVLLLTR